MNAKERFYSGLAKETIGKITSNTDNWTSFLRTMSRNYEFTYPEQVMIYAQRPNATFCKPYEDWNAENYRRYVKRGSTGIALFVIEYIQTLNRLLNMNDIKFSRMKITDVLIDDGIVATCSVCLSSLDKPRNMVQKYKSCISQLTVSIEKGVGPVALTLYSSGSVVTSKDRDDIDDETLECINIIMGGEL